MEKTPRVLLLEYLQNENGTKPVYTELPPYFPDPLSTISLFHYEVSAFNGKYVGTGYGVAKREAKHDAAKKILIKLAADKPDLKKFLEANRFDTMIERTYGGPDKNVLEKLNCKYNLKNNNSSLFCPVSEKKKKSVMKYRHFFLLSSAYLLFKVDKSKVNNTKMMG